MSNSASHRQYTFTAFWVVVLTWIELHVNFPSQEQIFPIFPAPLECTFRSNLSTMVAPSYYTCLLSPIQFECNVWKKGQTHFSLTNWKFELITNETTIYQFIISILTSGMTTSYWWLMFRSILLWNWRSVVLQWDNVGHHKCFTVSMDSTHVAAIFPWLHKQRWKL